MPPARGSAQPVIFNKLCDILKNPGIFSEISHEDAGSSHTIDGVVNNQYFSATNKTEKGAKDEFALAVFKHFQQDKPIKNKAAENKCVGQMLCWNSDFTVSRFHRGVRFEFVSAKAGKVTVAAVRVDKTKNEEGKNEISKTQILTATAANIHDAKYTAALDLINQEEYRQQYCNWVKHGGSGYKQLKEGEELPAQKSKPNWVKQEDGIEGDNTEKLAEFCEKYGIPAPEYFLSGDDETGTKALCKILIQASNPSKEAACKVINDILVQICADQDEANAAAKLAERDAAKTANEEKMAAKRQAAQERKERKAEAMKRKGDKSTGVSPEKRQKTQAMPVALAVYTQEMLMAGFGNQLEQFPILALEQQIKGDENMSGKAEFSAPVAGDNGGFKSTATVNGISATGHAQSKKMAKQVAAQALLMTLRVAASQPAPVAQATSGAPQPLNAVAHAHQAAQTFKQELSFTTDDGAVTADGKTFSTVATFGPITVSGHGSNKKASKLNTAEILLPAIAAQFGDGEAIRKANKLAKSKAQLAKFKEAKAAKTEMETN